MNSGQIKVRLERALHTTITAAEWEFLEDVGLVHEYEVDQSDWSEFRRGVEYNLSRIRRFRENDLRDQAGELEEAPRETSADHQAEEVPVDLNDRTMARSSALGALNSLLSGGSAPPRSAMSGTLLPRGGADGTVPQFVWVMAAELWVPAEDIARSFRTAQRTLMDKPNQPRTQARAFQVARFVWEVKAAHGGERPSWPALCKLWNDSPMTEPFDHWRDFRTYFKRGERATLPRYKATDEELTEQVRVATARGEAVAFDAWVRQVLAATVQQDSDGQ